MQGKKKTTTFYTPPIQTYRSLKGLNQSMISDFDENPSDFYNYFIMGIKRKNKKSISFDIGDLVDFYLLDCHGDELEFDQRFSEKFALYSGVKTTAQAFFLADCLFEITERDADEEGNITTSFEERFREAFDCAQEKDKYKGKTWDKALEDFNKVAKDYFDKLLENIGKSVVDIKSIEKAKFLVTQLRQDEFFGEFINQSSNGEIEVLKKVAIEFKYMGWDCKGEIDFLHIDHLHKQIWRRDLKTAFDNEGFEYSYIKYYYYIQNAFYHIAAQEFAKQNGLEDYEVLPMDFLVLDTSKNNRRPLLYKTSEKHIEQGLYGFYYRDIYHRGVNDLIDEISWCLDNSIWNISKENYENHGIVELKEFE